jgi:thymidylate synthase
MHTVELLEQALEVARQAGYKIRQEWLDDCQGGACIVKGQKWLFLDPTRSHRDQLEEVIDVLRNDADARKIVAAAEVQHLIGSRHAA